MDDVRIGAGDRIVTRRNDTTRDVANREAFAVEAISTDGTLVARAGERHIRLDPGYVAEAVQLGYASTDYGNQGMTADTSITLIGDATSAGGLYVGATRGRYDNTLHVVAPGMDHAREAIVAALGRDPSDKGLDVARAAAEAASERPTPVVDAEASATMGRLNKAAAREQADQAARATAAGYLDLARRHSEREAWYTDGLGDAIRQDNAGLLAYRDDLRIINAGPGLFGRRADRVAQAQLRCEEYTKRWRGRQLPQADWTDDQVRQVSADHVTKAVQRKASYHRQQAAAAEKQGQALLASIASRKEAERIVAFVSGSHPGGMSNLLWSGERSPGTQTEPGQKNRPLSPAELVERGASTPAPGTLRPRASPARPTLPASSHGKSQEHGLEM